MVLLAIFSVICFIANSASLGVAAFNAISEPPFLTRFHGFIKLAFYRKFLLLIAFRGADDFCTVLLHSQYALLAFVSKAFKPNCTFSGAIASGKAISEDFRSVWIVAQGP
ncbi:hypothetical protein OK016_00785 [Vibrio chagasii]|nr:hypothetical protein [Vibrio chagasii]